MPVRLLDAYHRIAAETVTVVGFPDSQVNGLALIMTMPNYPTVVADHIPAVVGLVVIDMEGML
jgi:hypothetical protein